MERTFEVPHAAAGPLVTPTKPTFSSFSAACDRPAPAESARIETAQKPRLARMDRRPNMHFSLWRRFCIAATRLLPASKPVDIRFAGLSTIWFRIVYDTGLRRCELRGPGRNRLRWRSSDAGGED